MLQFRKFCPSTNNMIAAASDANNQMLTHYHHGVFGLVNKGRWSCCANTSRACHGCSLVTKPKREGEWFKWSYSQQRWERESKKRKAEVERGGNAWGTRKRIWLQLNHLQLWFYLPRSCYDPASCCYPDFSACVDGLCRWCIDRQPTHVL